jgi:hypothetical protein
LPSVYTYHREVENAWLVRQRDRRRQRELALVVLVALPVVAALIGYTWLHVRMLHSAYRLQELAGELAEADRLRGALAVEAAGLAALPEVERRAAAELGMTEQTVEATWTYEEVMAEPVPAAPPLPLPPGGPRSVPLAAMPVGPIPVDQAPAGPVPVDAMPVDPVPAGAAAAEPTVPSPVPAAPPQAAPATPAAVEATP